MALATKMCVLLLPNIQMLAMSLALGNPELGDHMPTIISFKQLLWDSYFSTDKAQSTASLTSAILNAVLGRGSSSNLQIPGPWKVLEYLKITLRSSFQSFYRLSFAFPLPLLTCSLCTWNKTQKKQQQGKKLLCRDEPQQCNLSVSVKTHPPLLLLG